MTHCLNCNQGVEGKFCSQCGQKASTHRFSVPHVMHEIPHSLFHLDKGIFKNIKSILYPRQAVQEYMGGRRVSYFNPFLFFFLTLGLLFYLSSLLHLDTTLVINVPYWNVKGYNEGRWINNFVKFLYVGCAFLFALPNTFLFRRETGFNYAEHVIACLFMMGYVNLVSFFVLPLPFIHTFPLNGATGLLMVLFDFLIYRSPKWWVGLLKSMVAVLLYFLLFLLTLVVIGFLGYLILNIKGVT